MHWSDTWWLRVAPRVLRRENLFRHLSQKWQVKRTALPILFCFAVIPRLLFAQGQDNITGVMGGFNGWVTSGGMYDPYTGNARRVVTDITVPGAIGVGLSWQRILNTTYPISSGSWGLGFGRGGWGSNWTWLLAFGGSKGAITYPNGDSFTFNVVSGGTYTMPGIGDQLRPSAVGYYLYRSDGSKVFFRNIVTQGISYYQAQQFIDPYGQITTISYNPSGQMSQITDPTGRWLKITYNSAGNISQVSSINGQSVQYSYGTFGQYSVSVLTGASYSDGTSATYTYQTCNVGSYGGEYYGDDSPLPLSLSDCRANSKMQQIQYRFVSGGFPGFLSAELNASGQAVSTLQVPNNNTRVEVRGDGQTRTFNYSNALLTSASQFSGVSYYYWYDSNDFINQIQNPDTYQTQIQRTQFGTVTKITHPDGSSRTITYTDPNNPYWVASVTNELGNTTTYTRDSNNRVNKIVYPDGTGDSYWYNSLGEVTQHQQPNAASEYFTYNSVGQLTAYQDFAGQQYNCSWNSAYLLSGTQEVARNIWTYFTYNNRGQLTTLSYPDGNEENFGYNNYGWLTSWTNEDWYTWQTQYDAYGRVSTQTDPLGRTTQYFYARPGQTELLHTANAPSQIVDPGGVATEMVYDGDWRLTYQTIGTGSQAITTHMVYDGLGLQTQFVDGAGDTTTYGYDNRSRLTSVTDPNGNQTAYTYDALGETLTRTDPDGKAWNWLYNAMGRMVQSTDSMGAVSNYAYTALGELFTYTDPYSSVYTWTYDADGRKTGLNYPGAGTEGWGYDTSGNLYLYWPVSGNAQNFTYDVRNRLTQSYWASDSSQPNVSYSYDGAGNVLQISNQASTITYTYDKANEVTSEVQAPTGGTAQTIDYYYYGNGLPFQLDVPGTYSNEWQYDSRNLVSSISDVMGHTFATYTYDSAGRLSTRSLGNGASTSYGYDAGSRLINQVDSLAQGATWPAAISYNQVNEVTGISHNGMGDDRAFGYSPRRYLNHATVGGPTAAAGTYGFTYDMNGNWLNMKAGGTLETSLTTDSINRYWNVTTYANGTPTTTTLNYDSQDNLLGLNGASFQFNFENRLTSATNGTNTVKCAYDGLGRCVKRTVNGVTRYITYSGWKPILETGPAGGIKDARVYGLGMDDLIVDLTPSLTPNFYYHQDVSGNVQFVTDPNGNLIERYSYNPFGTFSVYDPNWNSLSASSVGNRFYFQGREYLAGIDTYDFRNRAYSPVLGRFLQMDPIRFGGGNNLYRFAGNDPVNGSDPLGLDEYASAGAQPLDQVTTTGYLPDEIDTPVFGSGGNQIGINSTGTDPVYGFMRWHTTFGPNGELIGKLGLMNSFSPSAGTNSTSSIAGGLPSYVSVSYDSNGPAAQAIRGVSEYIGPQLPQFSAQFGRYAADTFIGLATLGVGGVVADDIIGEAEGEAVGGGTIAPYFPPNNGFLGQTSRQFLYAGEKIDRYGGSAFSRFFSPAGTPAAARSLPASSLGQPLRTFQVVKPFEVEAGTVAPAFGQPGFGQQFLSPIPLQTLLDRGILIETTE